MELKDFLVMTSFGLVPYSTMKNYMNSKITETTKEDKKEDQEDTIPMDIGYYCSNLAHRYDIDPETMIEFLGVLAEFNFAAVFQIILKEIAIELDKKYVDHIENSEKIYCISTTNGHIFELDKKFIKNYKNFSAFRTVDDAKLACKITRNLLKVMFKGDK